jgi:hypothetical protein
MASCKGARSTTTSGYEGGHSIHHANHSRSLADTEREIVVIIVPTTISRILPLSAKTG